MKKLLAVLAAALLVISCCGGCGAAPSEVDGTSGSETEQHPSGDSDPFVFWHYYSGSTADNMVKMLEEYASDRGLENFETQVVFIPFGDVKKQLSVSTAAGTLPDLVLVDGCDCVSYAAMGIFADLTDVMADNENMKDYYEGILASTRYNGRMYAVPFMSNDLAIMYNKSMFEAAGITKIPESFEELRETAKALTTDTVFGFGMVAIQNEEATYSYLPFHMAACGDSYDPYVLDCEGGLNAMTMLAGMIEDGSMPKDVIAWGLADLDSQFGAEKIAMMMNGSWEVVYDEESFPDIEWDAFPVREKTVASVFGGENLAAIDGPQKERAIDVLDWYMTYEVVKKWTATEGHFPPRDATMSDEFYQGEGWKTFIDLIPYSLARPADVKYPEVSTGYQMALQEALTLSKTPEEALKDGQAMIDAALAK